MTLATKAIDTIVATPAPESGPRWSPDGTHHRVHDAPDRRRDDQSRRDLDAAALQLATDALRCRDQEGPDVSDPTFDNSPGAIVWTPDSKRLLFGVGDRAYRSVVAYDLSTRSIQPADQGADDRVRQRCPEQGRFESGIHDGFAGRADRRLRRRADFSCPAQAHEYQRRGRGFRARRDRGRSRGRARTAGRVEGMLVKPVGYQAGEALSLLVDVHGGPTGAHTNGFKVGVHNGGQFWAGQGWAVLYPNPRGSTGYGEKFMRGEHPRLGRRRLSRHHGRRRRSHQARHRRPAKLAVMGWSYGGYMTSLGRLADEALQGRADGRRAVEHRQHVRHDRHSRLHRHVLQQLSRREDTEALPRTVGAHLRRSGHDAAPDHAWRNDERVPIGQPMEFYRALPAITARISPISALPSTTNTRVQPEAGARGRVHKAIPIAPDVQAAIHATRLDIVTERITERDAGSGYDLVIVTKVFPYLSDPELIVAIANIAACARAGRGADP